MQAVREVGESGAQRALALCLPDPQAEAEGQERPGDGKAREADPGARPQGLDLHPGTVSME